MKAGRLIKEARLRAGISQAELARRVGSSQPAIARVESGAVSPSVDRLSDLIRACGFDLELRLTPHDTAERALARSNMALSPDERIRKMLTSLRAARSARPTDQRVPRTYG